MLAIESRTGSYLLKSITYRAESATLPGVVYTVTVDDDGWSCSCKASEFTKTRGRCWHVKAAQAGTLGKPHIAIETLARPA